MTIVQILDQSDPKSNGSSERFPSQSASFQKLPGLYSQILDNLIATRTQKILLQTKCHTGTVQQHWDDIRVSRESHWCNRIRDSLKIWRWYGCWYESPGSTWCRSSRNWRDSFYDWGHSPFLSSLRYSAFYILEYAQHELSWYESRLVSTYRVGEAREAHFWRVSRFSHLYL